MLHAVRLTEVHKPNVTAEQERLIQAGHFVSEDTVSALEGEQVHMLRMSRCIGDHDFKENHPNGVIAVPDVSSFTFDEGDRFIVLATDGLWDVITEDEVVTIVDQNEAATDACKELIQEAKQRWHSQNGQYCDDITITCVMLPCFQPDIETIAEDGITEMRRRS